MADRPAHGVRSPFELFTEAMRRILAVPKSAIEPQLHPPNGKHKAKKKAKPKK